MKRGDGVSVLQYSVSSGWLEKMSWRLLVPEVEVEEGGEEVGGGEGTE